MGGLAISPSRRLPFEMPSIARHPVSSIRFFLTAGQTQGSFWSISPASYLEWIDMNGNRRVETGKDLSQYLLRQQAHAPQLFLKTAPHGHWIRLHLWANSEGERHYTAHVLAPPFEDDEAPLTIVGQGRLDRLELERCTENAPQPSPRPSSRRNSQP
jgi:hypothetical protein